MNVYIILYEFFPELQCQANAGDKTEMWRETPGLPGAYTAPFFGPERLHPKENLTIIIFPMRRRRPTLTTGKVWWTNLQCTCMKSFRRFAPHAPTQTDVKITSRSGLMADPVKLQNNSSNRNGKKLIKSVIILK